MRIYQILFSVFFIFLFSSCIYMPPGRGGEYTYAPKVYYSKGKYDATYDFVKETFVEPAKVNNIKTSVVDSTRKDNRTEKIEYEADKTIKVTIFKKDSILYSTSYYSVYDTSDFRNNIACGEHITFYEDGKAQLVENFNRNGKLDGDFKSFYPNGKLKRHDTYKDDRFVSGKCFDSTGTEVPWYEFEKEPFVDLNLMKENLEYPENLRREGVEAEIVVRIFINKNGKAVKMKYDKGCPKDFILSIIKCIKQDDFFKAACFDGEPEGVWVSIPFTFRLRD